MSLRFWTPLIGDLHNQGLDDVQFSNPTPDWTNDGKIGKAFISNGKTATVNIPSLNASVATTVGSTEQSGEIRRFTFSFWARVLNTNTHANYSTTISFGLYTKSKSDYGSVETNTEFWLQRDTNTSANNTSALYWTYYNQSNVVYNSGTSSPDDRWHLYTITCDGEYFRYYRDGSAATAYKLSDYLSKYRLIGNLSIGNANSQVYLNDVRIYDHCLSQQEVKEISKGLCVHYTLGSESVYEATTNYASGTWSSYTSYWTIQSQDRNNLVLKKNTSSSSSTVALYNSNIQNNMTAGETWTMSCYLYKNGSPYKTSANVNTTYTDHATRISSISRDDGFFSVTFSVVAKTNQVFHIAMFDSCSDGQLVEIRAIQFEKKDRSTQYVDGTRSTGIVYDSSGYSRNGTISGNLSIDSNTPRYNKAIQFPASSASTITTPLSIDNSAWTIAFWEKCDWTNTETSNAYILYSQRIRILKYSNTGRMMLAFFYKNSEGTQTAATPYFMDTVGTDTSWKYFVATFDGQVVKLYLDGTYVEQRTLPSGFQLYNITGNLVLNYNTTETISKSLSDFRIYATALSSTDIQELYNLKNVT